MHSWEHIARKHYCLSICEYWLSWTNTVYTVSEQKIPIPFWYWNGDPVYIYDLPAIWCPIGWFLWRAGCCIDRVPTYFIVIGIPTAIILVLDRCVERCERNCKWEDGSGTSGKTIWPPQLVSTTSRLRLPSPSYHRSCSSFLPSFYSSWLPSGIFGTADIVYTFALIIFNQVLGEILQLPSMA